MGLMHSERLGYDAQGKPNSSTKQWLEELDETAQFLSGVKPDGAVITVTKVEADVAPFSVPGALYTYPAKDGQIGVISVNNEKKP